MANQTDKSTQGNLSNSESTGQSGTSTGSAGSGSASGGLGNQNSPMTDTQSTGANMTTGQPGGSAVAAAKDTARNLVDQAKTTASDAYGAVTEKATTKLEEQKTTLAGGLSSVAESVRSMGDNLNQSPEKNPLADYTAQYAGTAAQKLEQVAGYFERKDVRAMARDIESFARRNPALFLGGAFALGMLAARFIKSSPTMPADRFNTGIDHQLPSAGKTQSGNLGTATGASMTGTGTTGTSGRGTGTGSMGTGGGGTGTSRGGGGMGTAGAMGGSTGTTGGSSSGTTGGAGTGNTGKKTPGAM